MAEVLRLIKRVQKTGKPHSENTEIWKSGFFWPFFSNLSYEEITSAVLDHLIEIKSSDQLHEEIPDDLIESYGESCYKAGLLDSEGNFNDPHKLVKFLCGGNK